MIGAIGNSSLSSLAVAARGSELSLEQQRQLVALQRADREVRAHEQAHMAAGAGLVRGSSYSYEAGPDNRRYAVAGEVSIDASPGRTPEETIAKARQIRAAALAPADPSTADRQVAAAAGQMEMQAQRELAQADRAETGSDRESPAIAAYRQVAANESGVGFAAVA
ncbi:MAG: catalase [Azonexus sp.]|jgi:hypothetical protein|uniref:putative metalloprotease CJM1_0395 family protein n=1 Tax=Azonexus sp. TaxID=1872668 RepID=UPI002834B0A9|nr:putative metalloprotease CJM1_0395 family protein [Azonexus sp.]MDR0776512.1 catalase [Azonexus sp.]